MLTLLSLAGRNLWRRNRRRTCLTIFAAAAATLAFCAVMVVPYVISQVAHLADFSPRLVVMNRASFRYGLPESYAAKIAKLPDVVALNRMEWFAGIYDDPKHQFPTMALDADNTDVVWPEYGLDPGTMAAFKSAKDAAIVGIATMHRFGWRVGQTVALRSQIYPITLTFRICGVYRQGPDLTCFMLRRDYMEEALHNPGRVDLLWVRCSSSEATSRVAAAIDETFRNSAAETETGTEKAFLVNFISSFRPLGLMVEGIGAGAVVALALAVLNATAMSLRERRAEVAVLRSLGFVADQILLAFALEALLIALAGGLLGIVAAWAFLAWVRGPIPALGPLLSFGLPFPVMVGGFAVALAIGLTAGVMPAIGAVRSSVVDALRRPD